MTKRKAKLGRPLLRRLLRKTISLRMDAELLDCLDKHRPATPRTTKVESAVVAKLRAENADLPKWAEQS